MSVHAIFDHAAATRATRTRKLIEMIQLPVTGN
jgi:hypothetical protein